MPIEINKFKKIPKSWYWAFCFLQFVCSMKILDYSIYKIKTLTCNTFMVEIMKNYFARLNGITLLVFLFLPFIGNASVNRNFNIEHIQTDTFTSRQLDSIIKRWHDNLSCSERLKLRKSCTQCSKSNEGQFRLTLENNNCTPFINKWNTLKIENINLMAYNVEIITKADTIKGYDDQVGKLATKIGIDVTELLKLVKNSIEGNTKLVENDDKFESVFKAEIQKLSDILVGIDSNYKKILLAKNIKEAHPCIDRLKSLNGALLKVRDSIITKNNNSPSKADYIKVQNTIQQIDTLRMRVGNLIMIDKRAFEYATTIFTSGNSTSFKVKITPKSAELGLIAPMFKPHNYDYRLQNRWATRAFLSFSLGTFTKQGLGDQLLYSEVDSIFPNNNGSADSSTYTTQSNIVKSSSALLFSNISFVIRPIKNLELGITTGASTTLFDNKLRIGYNYGITAIIVERLQISYGFVLMPEQSIRNEKLIGQKSIGDYQFTENNYAKNWVKRSYISLGYSIPLYN